MWLTWKIYSTINVQYMHSHVIDILLTFQSDRFLFTKSSGNVVQLLHTPEAVSNMYCNIALWPHCSGVCITVIKLNSACTCMVSYLKLFQSSSWQNFDSNHVWYIKINEKLACQWLFKFFILFFKIKVTEKQACIRYENKAWNLVYIMAFVVWQQTEACTKDFQLCNTCTVKGGCRAGLM